MKFQIKHEIKGRLRIHMKQSRMTFEQADILHYAIQKMDGVSSVKVYERTGDAVICFHCSREELVDALSAFDYDRVNVPMEVLQNSGRQLNAEFQEKLAGRILRRFFNKIFLPMPLKRYHSLQSDKICLDGYKVSGCPEDRSACTGCDSYHCFYPARELQYGRIHHVPVRCW